VVGTIAVPKGPHGLVVTPDGRKVYVSSDGDSKVTPRKIAVQPQSARRTSGTTPPRAERAAVSIGGFPVADHGTLDVRGMARVTLRADDYYFAPTFLQGRSGQRLRLAVKNESSALHNLSATALGLDRDLPPGAQLEIDITFPLSDPAHFFCKFHAPLGQNGLLLVAGAQDGTHRGRRNATALSSLRNVLGL